MGGGGVNGGQKVMVVVSTCCLMVVVASTETFRNDCRHGGSQRGGEGWLLEHVDMLRTANPCSPCLTGSGQRLYRLTCRRIGNMEDVGACGAKGIVSHVSHP